MEPTAVETSGAEAKNERIFVSPLAKKLATDKGVDLSKVTGSGENGAYC